MTDRDQGFSELRLGTLYQTWKAANPGSAVLLDSWFAGGPPPRTDPSWGATTAGLGYFAQALDGFPALTAPSSPKAGDNTLWEKWVAANPGEATKLAAYRAGAALFPSMATQTGKAFALFARMLKPHHPLWHRNISFSVKLPDLDATEKAALRSKGFGTLAPILTNHIPAEVAANKADLRNSGAAYRSLGWSLAGWGTYGQSQDTVVDARAAATVVEDLNLDGWIANGELWAESEFFWKTAAFISEWLRLVPEIPLAISCLSTSTPQWVRPFDYATPLATAGVSIRPQVYGGSSPGMGFTVAGARTLMARAGVSPARYGLTLGTFGNSIPWSDYATWAGIRDVYCGEMIPPGEIANL